MSNRFIQHVAMLAIVAFILPACVQRKETLVIHPDGGIDITVEHRSDSERDLMDGDAPPTLDRGWFVERSVEEKEDGKKTYILTAEAKFAPGEDLPDDYASVLDSYPDTNLQFPTTVEYEQRRDGVYCHVRRVYEARPWAYLERPRQLVEQQIKELVGDGDVQEMDLPSRIAVLDAVARLELMKIESFAHAAFDDIAPDMPQDLWLRMRGDTKNAIDVFDSSRLAELMAEDAEFDDDELAREQQKLEDQAIKAMRLVLGDTHWFGAGTTKAFMDRYTRHRRYFEVTEDLGDDAFEITIEMPGEIIAHNADETHGSRTMWKFSGEFIRDRDHELLVTSRLPE